MLAGLATSHKVGILIVGAAFIVFALASSFLLPALRPSFPGRGVKLYSLVALLFTAGMLATVIVLAKEPKEKRAAAAETATETAPAQTSGGQATTQAAAPSGDAAAGKSLFGAQGCNSCHTFKPAGATGKVGPDLDKLAADAQKANRGTEAQYIAESIRDPSAYVVPGYPNGVMPPFKQLSDTQVADLVAFLSSG